MMRQCQVFHEKNVSTFVCLIHGCVGVYWTYLHMRMTYIHMYAYIACSLFRTFSRNQTDQVAAHRL